jgi:hypothetical protein
MNYLKEIFIDHPMLIFKEIDEMNPPDFINFVKQFDPYVDEEALVNPYSKQLLQPFDQFPKCVHVTPRGNMDINNFHNINELKVRPHSLFMNYFWHTDLLGHPYKLPNVITGFYIVEQPVIGGDTDFISGETIYENLTDEEKIGSEQILVEVNRLKYLNYNATLDYSGCIRTEKYVKNKEDNNYIPILFSEDKKRSILILPGIIERIVGWSVEDSRTWVKNFMIKNVLPHRVSIQWKKKDLALFNNRKFIHSASPVRNYMDFKENSTRLLLQAFVPTNKPLIGIKPKHSNPNVVTELRWVYDKHEAIMSSIESLKFSMITSRWNNRSFENNTNISITDDEYLIAIKDTNIKDGNERINPYGYNM